MMELKQGATVGGYSLVRLVGRGGFGEVWEARARDGVRVALKLLHSTADRDAQRRFLREARILPELQHRNCVRFIELVADKPRPIIATEFVDGVTLRHWAAERPRTIAEIIDVSSQIAHGLTAAHKHGVVHRDLKPANIMVTPEGSSVRVCILDFGIASLRTAEQRDITKTGEVIGTPGFMSPEQLLGHRPITPRSDLYCLGVILFELLEGRPPFTGATSLELSMAHLMNPLPVLRRADTPDQLATLVPQLLAKNASERPTSAEYVVRVLDGHAPRQTTAIAEPTAKPGGALVLGMALLLLTLFGGAVFSLREVEPPTEVPRTRVSPQLLRGPRHVPISAAETESEESVAALPPGCGVARKPGQQSFSERIGLDLVQLGPVYIPKSYDPMVRHPAIVVLSANDQPPEDALREVQLNELADTHGIVLLGLPDAHRAQWREGNIHEVFVNDHIEWVRQLQEFTCVDEDRIWGLSRGHGGDVAHLLACRGVFDAIVTTSYRLAPEQCGRICMPERPIPHLALSPLHERKNPAEGDDRAAPLRTHEDEFARVNRCEGDRREAQQQPAGATCYTWTCEAEFVSCHLDTAQRSWPNYTRIHDSGDSMTYGPIEFNYQNEIWAFLSGLQTDHSQ